MPSSYRFVASGKVQGVGFRQATARRAAALALDGWVRNREDGSVEGLASADDAEALAEFRRWLAVGPPGARVDALRWERTEAVATPSSAPGFSICR